MFNNKKLKVFDNSIVSKRRITLVLIALIWLSFLSCNSDENVTKPDPDPPPQYETGKNYYTTEVEGVTREYYVHVPAIYNPNNPTPVVFMLHGATGNGLGTYNNSGWKELGETENIITVFPTALVYCYTNSFGVTKTATRWNSYPPVVDFCSGQSLKDDVEFLQQVVTELHQQFNVDSSRIYMVGFSSGAQMAFRFAVEMSNVFAAIVQVGASHQVDTVFTTQRNLPVSVILGNRDETWFQNINPVPMSWFDSSLTAYSPFQRIIKVHANSFDFEQTYTMTGDTNSVLIATFKGIPDVGNRQFNFAFVKGLDHSYPNGVNHPMYGARVNWEWMKQYSLP